MLHASYEYSVKHLDSLPCITDSVAANNEEIVPEDSVTPLDDVTAPSDRRSVTFAGAVHAAPQSHGPQPVGVFLQHQHPGINMPPP
jgi:hypothetical protein